MVRHLSSLLCALPLLVAAAPPPNILWLYQEDTSPWMGCYEHPANAGHTPHIDRLAAEGVLFRRAFVPNPVCSTCRSSLITGTHALRWGGHQHRSARDEAARPLPEGIRTLPELMQQAGYTTFNVGKTDYNFIETGRNLYTRIPPQHRQRPWKALPEGVPFFGQIQLQGGKTNTRTWPEARRTDPASITVPADYPPTQLYREVVAQHCDAIRSDDARIGRILGLLAEEGLAGSTIVVYFSDHGANNLPRHKQMPTEGGLHVPFVIRGPEQWVPRGVVRDDLVSLLDLSVTTLAWAGVAPPAHMEGRHLFAPDFRPRAWVAASKDRLDHTIDRVRSIRTDRYRYTRNYFFDRILLQPQYRYNRPPVQQLHTLYRNGTLDPKLAHIYFGERPAEELYDVVADPAQVHNLAADPAHAEALAAHRLLLDAWLAQGDQGAAPEPDMELEVNGWRRWGKGVNPAYERIRTDDDGDGLSSRWEEATGRDPEDGKLLFTFNCGGWQTEGWASSLVQDPLAGPLGTLAFTLPNAPTRLTRSGLQTAASRNPGQLMLRLKSTQPLTLVAHADHGELTRIGEVQLPASDTLHEVKLGTTPAPWTGTLKELTLDLVPSAPSARVVIDHIEVQP